MGREAALQVLFAADSTGGVDADSALRCFEDVCGSFSLPTRARERAHELVVAVAQNLKHIDESIDLASAHWKVTRLATVDRNVLRIATYELLYEPDTPAEVIIDEAVEVARRFGGDQSPAFVNGVLDQLARQRQGSA